MSQESFEHWCIVELMGRNIIAGFVTEQTIGGAALVRVDVPEIRDQLSSVTPGFTKLFGASAIYAMTPTDEATARAVAARLKTRPIEPWVLPPPEVMVIEPPSEDPDYELDEDVEDDDLNDDPPPF